MEDDRVAQEDSAENDVVKEAGLQGVFLFFDIVICTITTSPSGEPSQKEAHSHAQARHKIALKSKNVATRMVAEKLKAAVT